MNLKNLSIRSKLLIISLLPLVALSYFLYTTVADALERKATMLEVYDEFSEIESMSKLLHHLQLERGLVSTFLAEPTEENKREMADQMQASDLVTNEVQKIFAQHHKSSPILPFLDSLQFHRESLPIYPVKLNQYKLHLLSAMGKTLRKSRNANVKDRLESHVFLLHAKEYFAQMRSILSSASSYGQFKKREYGDFAVLKGAAERNFARFIDNAPSEISKYSSQRLVGNAVLETSQSVDSVFSNPAFIRQINPEEWWTNSTTAINLLKQVEDFSLNAVRELAEQEMAAINTSVYISIAIAVLIAAIIVLVVSMTIKQIVTNLS